MLSELLANVMLPAPNLAIVVRITPTFACLARIVAESAISPKTSANVTWSALSMETVAVTSMSCVEVEISPLILPLEEEVLLEIKTYFLEHNLNRYRNFIQI